MPDSSPSRRARSVRAYVGLGANLGDAPATLAAAVAGLAALPRVQLRGVSRLYLTRPVGVTEQPAFHNAVVALDVPAGPDPATGGLAFLTSLKSLERAFGRRRRRRWGPRELDLDLLLFGRHRLHVPRAAAQRSLGPARSGVQWLDVPHAAAGERLFVLAPLADLAAGLRPPGWRRTVEEARRWCAAAEGPSAVVPVGEWDAAQRSWRPAGRP
ncbi:MAG: 2-amino-4-hydroxy-6-hydroxymethyldihydropteridine diphosphokinase [Candidatus Limnocylindrales bacterium]